MSKSRVLQKSNSFKIGLYIRVSTEEQAENPEGSIRNQEDRLRQAVQYKNHSGTFGEIAGLYVDAGISAKNMKRPKLQELLRAIRNKEIDLVMVTELSRLSRNTRDFIDMWDMMRDHGCSFSSLREDFDTTTAAGEMVIFQLMNLAQFERKQTSERVEANIAARAARGLYNGGAVPIGYQLIPEKPGYLAVDDDMVKTVQTAFTTFLREGSLSKAAKWMNDNGYELKRKSEGGGSFARSGHFTVDNLQAMLRNKVYIGVKSYSHRGELKEAKAAWQRIIDEMIFHRAGKVLDQNRSRLKPETRRKLPYILTGLSQCLKCQNPMSGKSATGNVGKVGYYEHIWATKRDSTLTKKLFTCEPHRVPAKKLEPLVLAEFKSQMIQPEFMKRVLAKVREHHEKNPHRKDEERFKAKVHGITSQIEAMAERLSELPKSISAGPIYKQMERLEGVRREHEEALITLKSTGQSSLDRIVDLDSFQDFAKHYRVFLNEASPDQTKQMLKKFIKKIEVGMETVRIHWIVDKDHFKRELALKRAVPVRGSSLGSHFFRDFGSNTLTIGDSTRS